MTPPTATPPQDAPAEAKPAPVSLEKMRGIFNATGKSCRMPDGSWQSEIDMKEGIRAVLEAAGVPYTDEGE